MGVDRGPTQTRLLGGRRLKRLHRVGVWPVAMVMIFALVSPAVALAACDAHANGSVWNGSDGGDPNCTVGFGFDTAANYITGVQRILKGLGYYGGSIDGIWGSLSEGATKNFQASEGLTQDGIVGPATWGRLDNQIAFCVQSAPYRYYRAPATSCNGSFRYAYNTSLNWYVRTLGGTWQAAFSTSGPS